MSTTRKIAFLDVDPTGPGDNAILPGGPSYVVPADIGDHTDRLMNMYQATGTPVPMEKIRLVLMLLGGSFDKNDEQGKYIPKNPFLCKLIGIIPGGGSIPYKW